MNAIFPPPVDQRTLEIAGIVLEIVGQAGGCTEADLLARGVTRTELARIVPDAIRMANERFVRRIEPAADRLADVIDKAIDALPARMPVMGGEGNEATPEMGERWALYCRARLALSLDGWVGQRERCLTLLDRFCRKLPILDREINRVVSEVAGHLAGRRRSPETTR